MKHLLILPILLLALFAGGPVYSADSDNFAEALRDAEQGRAEAQYYVGNSYWKGAFVPENIKAAVKWLTLAAEQGHVDAQFRLGKMYHRGKGDRNPKAAVKWYTRAAEQGHRYAQLTLGIMYERGKKIPKNLKAAVKWYTLAAEQEGEKGDHARRRLSKLNGP